MAGARPLILAADVGGTNSRFAFYAEAAGELELVWQWTYPSREGAALPELARRAREDSGFRPAAATFGVAGPVQDGRCRATNLPWAVDSAELAASLGLGSVGLLNDLEASAHGLVALRGGDLGLVQAGASGARGNMALCSAGTGLGQAGLYWDGRDHRPFACEGGHASFSPVGELQEELLAWLRERFGHVSWERVLSGPGLVNLYRFHRGTKRGSEPADFVHELEERGAAAITSSALDRTNERAVLTLELFCSLYGSEASNLALKVMATGGVFLGGGIAPKIEAWLARPQFLEAFLGKGRLRPLLEGVPVCVVRNEHTALLGAARHALNAWRA